MTYSIIGILATAIMFIINRDVLWENGSKSFTSTQRKYRAFLMGVTVYYITDAFWGIFDTLRLTAFQYADTVVYFIAMVASVLLWARYVVSYLEGERMFGRALYMAGRIFFALSLLAIAINLFNPILFWFDEAGAYHAEPARYALLAVQILMFLLTSAYTLYVTARTEGVVRRRHLTIGLFGIAMVILVAFQIVYPLLPFYAMGYLLGTCLLHSFVVEDEKDEYRHELERSLERERAQKQELSESREALAEALDAAERANRAKTVFLNNMSHDIRTPMNAIVGFAALASSHVDNEEQVRDYLDKISVSSQHLLSLINDALDMSRIESGKVTIEEADVHLPDLVHDLRTIIQPNVSERRQQLFIAIQDVKNEDIVIDKLRLNQVLLNILSNAIKFTPEGGTIAFRVIEKPSAQSGIARFEFRVKDNGIGMSEEFCKTIFEPFTREQSSTVSGIQGTGLGMAITKNIVDMMGGVIEVESTLGVGTEFIVYLPCKIGENPTRHEPIPELRGARVLVADDDENSCLSVCGLLEDLGMRPDWVNCGEDAVHYAEEAHERGEGYRLYLLDWQMPDENGIEVARRIRVFSGDDARIILLTAYDWTDAEKDAREAGVTTLCSKPIFASKLRRILCEPRKEPKREPQEEHAAPFAGKRILLAEDNEMNQQIAQAILEGSGFAVDIAPDGAEAVRMMEEAPAGTYDAILMDIQMPNMDGHEATERIRLMEDPEKSGIPIIAVTANAFVEDRKLALEHGMDAHLAKPYDIPAIMETLDEVLSRA